jgi:hypothetical protein
VSTTAFGDPTTVRDALRARPEWWVGGIGIACWVSILHDGIAQWGHAVHLRAGHGQELVRWEVMVLAMMLPTIASQARAVAMRSFGERRNRSMLEFLAGFTGPWLVVGMAAIAAREWSGGPSRWAVAGLCAVATGWAMLPLRERAMVMIHGHSPVIAPAGWPAARDCMRSGIVVGAWCVASCWPLMLACAFSGHHLVPIGAGAAIGVAESASFRPPRLLVIFVSATLTAFFLMN